MSTLQMTMALQITTRFITGDDIFLLLQIMIALIANHDKFFAKHEDYYKSQCFERKKLLLIQRIHKTSATHQSFPYLFYDSFLYSPLHSARDLNVLGYTVTIDFDDMLMTLRPLESQDTLNSQLRRLSTFDGSVDPFNPNSMSWTWYWEENGNVWRAYDKDCSVR